MAGGLAGGGGRGAAISLHLGRLVEDYFPGVLDGRFHLDTAHAGGAHVHQLDLLADFFPRPHLICAGKQTHDEMNHGVGAWGAKTMGLPKCFK